MIGRTYLEAGSPVRVLIRWGKTGAGPSAPIGKLDGSGWGSRRAPHNVLIERQDGSRVVRPFRGLRRAAESLATSPTQSHHREEPEDDAAANREQREKRQAEGRVFSLGCGFRLVDAHGAPPAPRQRMPDARGSRPTRASTDSIWCAEVVASADALDIAGAE